MLRLLISPNKVAFFNGVDVFMPANRVYLRVVETGLTI